MITFIEADVAIADALWDQWLAVFVSAPGKRRLLTSWGDIQPTKEQWRRATRMMRDAKNKVAVVTESRATSALAKAAAWGGNDMQAFRWDQLYEASLWLELEGPRRMAVRTAATSLRDCFGAVDGGTSAARPPASMSAPRPVPSASAAVRPLPSTSSAARPVASTSPAARPAASTSTAARPAASSSTAARPAASPSTAARPVATPRPTSSPSAPSSRPAAPSGASKTPMADAAERNLAQVRQTSEEIQTKLAEIQARLRNRAR